MGELTTMLNHDDECDYPFPNQDRLPMLITEANNLYRIGKPMMSDQEFDNLCDEYQKTLSPEEWEKFRNSLHENPGKVKHPFVMGSLNKIKMEEPLEVWKFVKTYVPNDLNISKKVDGISCRLFYDKGKLVSATTRGDGWYGEDITDKMKYVNGVPQTVVKKAPFSVRGELVIFTDDFDKMNEKGEWKNPRNACAGLMNRKDFSPEDISNVSFVCYTILGREYVKRDHFRILHIRGFNPVKSFEIPHDKLQRLLEDTTGQSLCNALYEYVKYETPYECDGLVLSDMGYLNEDKYRPDGQIAFKVNQLIGEADLIDVSWEGPTKSGRIVPIGILDGVELGGSTITRVTLNNVDFLEKLNVRYGARLRISKSGDIIPKVIKVLSEGISQILLPDKCPSCGSDLVREGVDLKCVNPECLSLKYSQILNVINKFGIDGVSLKTLENWEIDTIDDILSFRARSKYKSEQKFEIELETKMFRKTDLELFLRMNFNGLSDKLLRKIIERYGWSKLKGTFIKRNDGSNSWTHDHELEEFPMKYGYPNGIGQLMWERFIDGIDQAVTTMMKIMSDGRYIGKPETDETLKKVPSKGSICVTGSLNYGTREKFFNEIVIPNGYEESNSVKKGLKYLITNNKTSNTEKIRKALYLGIPIITEEYFMGIIKENAKDENVFSVDDL